MIDEHEHGEITLENLATPPMQIKPAPVLKRVAGGFIDCVILALLLSIFLIASGQNPVSSSALLSISGFSILAIVAFIYYFLQEALFSATLGKSIVKLRVLDRNGNECSFSASFKRNLLRFIDWLPLLYVVAAVSIMASAQGQRLGDRLAGTVVTERPEKDRNPPPAPFLFH